jgi:hypothetical protein
MAIDTRIAVIVFLFYLLNGILSFGNGQPFLPPFFMEIYLLGGITVFYFILSIRSVFSILFLLLAFHFLIMLYQPVLPQQPLNTLQKIALLIPVILPVVVYVHVALTISKEKTPVQITWAVHLFCFVISFWPAIFHSGAIISLIAGIFQALAGILLLSHDDSKLNTEGWKKRMVLVMILIVFFDVAQYLYYITSPAG